MTLWLHTGAMGKFAGKAWTDAANGSKSQSLSLDARYPPPTHTKTHPTANSAHARTHMLSCRYIHTQNTDVRSSPTHMHSQTLKHINTCPHSHTLAKIREDTKLVWMNFHVRLLPCMQRLVLASPFSTTCMHKFTHSLPRSHTTNFLRFGCLCLCPPLWTFSLLPLALPLLKGTLTSAEFSVYMCVCVCERGVMVWRGGLRCWITGVCFWQPVCECDRVQSSVGVLSAAAMQRLSGLDRALWLIATTLIG